MEQIRLTIVTELYMREMGVRQVYETIGGSSYASVRRHFRKLEEHGWIRKVRTAAVEGRGRPETLYRSTELAVIDTETWRAIPRSIRDAIMVQLLEAMGGRLGEALEHGTGVGEPDGVAIFRTFGVDEVAWCEAAAAVEQCFQSLLQAQTDAKIRLETGSGKPLLMVVNLAAFQASGEINQGILALPRANQESASAPWPQRVGKVFSDRLDLEIIYELNRATMTPAELQAALGLAGTSGQTFLRRCKRLTDLGWAVPVETETGGTLRGASVYRFRAAAPDVSASDICELVPDRVREGPLWEAFRPFIEASMDALGAGTFNNRSDIHLSMSPLLVDETGWTQVTEALHVLENVLDRVEADLAKRLPDRELGAFRAAFHLSSFRAHGGESSRRPQMWPS
jgi:DNA-binding PadR family transcriptional regulator